MNMHNNKDLMAMDLLTTYLVQSGIAKETEPVESVDGNVERFRIYLTSGGMVTAYVGFDSPRQFLFDVVKALRDESAVTFNF